MDITNYLHKISKLFVQVKTLLGACFPVSNNFKKSSQIISLLHVLKLVFVWFSACSVILKFHCLPMLDKTGPKALASAPRDRNTPITTPFWFVPPNPEISVVRHGTTVADAATQDYHYYRTFLILSSAIHPYLWSFRRKFFLFFKRYFKLLK